MREFFQRIQYGNAEDLILAGERSAVVEQYLTQAQQGVVYVSDVGARGLLIAQDGVDQIATQGARRNREAVQANLTQAMHDRVKA